jgi:shikimate dehydrogenase
VDLVYGPEVTPWVRAARAAGIEAVDGLGLLVFQAQRSLALWTGREVPLAPLARAVGWPR